MLSSIRVEAKPTFESWFTLLLPFELQKFELLPVLAAQPGPTSFEVCRETFSERLNASTAATEP